MSLIVQKFGGTSVANPNRIKEVAKRIIRTLEKGYDVVVVVSAAGDTTDRLISLAYEITPSPAEREIDMLISTGEQISSALLAMAIESLGHPAISFTGSQIEILTDDTHTKAKIVDINTERIWKHLHLGKVVVVAGFQGISIDKDITTLGRGGSDLTAVALAHVLKAKVCEIYTDVPGVYTANPKIVQDARKLDFISSEEMLELASSGAKVLQSRSVELAKKFGVLIHVRSSFTDEEGTMVKEKVKGMEEALVTGIAEDIDQAKITILDVPDRPGIAAKVFGELARESINVDMIIQSAPIRDKNDISFTIAKSDLEKSLKIMNKVKEEVGAKDVISDKNVAKVSVVGVGMRTHSGVAAKMFSALASKDINIEMISTSEIKISCIIKKDKMEEAVKILHDTFELGKTSYKDKDV
ncbi:MAG: aspartate kinase [bacterium]|nr:aspartate kinase [bacterium]